MAIDGCDVVLGRSGSEKRPTHTIFWLCSPLSNYVDWSDGQCQRWRPPWDELRSDHRHKVCLQRTGLEVPRAIGRVHANAAT